MARYRNPRLLTPPREEEEIYPYRRVWPSIIVEMTLLLAVTAVMFILIGFLGANLPRSLWPTTNVIIALLPAAAWALFSLWREYRVERPRRQLLSVFIVTALVANAISIPLINELNPRTWLSLAGTFERIFGYAATIGVAQVFTIYLVLRFLIWPDGLRIRLDALAYCMAGAVGYVTVANLHIAFDGEPSPDVLALRVFSNLSLHVASAAILAYGYAELRFKPDFFISLPASVLAAILLTGLGITFRAGLVNGGFVLGIGGTRPLFGLVFSALLIAGSLTLTYFLFTTAERRALEAEQDEA